MKLSEADAIAARLVAALAPHCLPGFCVVAGSVRRRKPEVKDIEVVCIPATVDEPTLFGAAMPRRDPEFCRALDSLGTRVKGEASGLYAARALPEGINLDCFMARPENWGLILAIRTGSADFSARVLAYGWSRRGMASSMGTLRDRHGNVVETRTERQVFEASGIPWTEPPDREWPPVRK